MIELRSLFLSVVGSGLAAWLPAQGGEAPKPEGSPPPAAAEKQVQGRTVAQWIDRLGAESFRDRVAAENALRELGAAALPGLRDAAESHADGEVQWRARRLVQQIERADGAREPQRLQPRAESPRRRAPDLRLRSTPDSFDEMQQRFDEVFRDMERDFGLSIPRRSFFGDDFFRDLTEQMEQLRTQGGGNSRGLSMQIGPDGAVRVEVQQQNEDGESETKVYEAPSLQEFQQQYPDVLPQTGFGMPFRLRIGADGQGGRPAPLFRALPFGGEPQIDMQPDPEVQVAIERGSVLGVQIRPEIGVELREHLGLEPGQGLMIESVTPESLAATMGLQRGDIVLKVAGRDIGEPGDVREALGTVEPGGKVVVECLRKGKPSTFEATKPAAAQPKSEPAKSGSGKLERRARKAGETIR